MIQTLSALKAGKNPLELTVETGISLISSVMLSYVGFSQYLQIPTGAAVFLPAYCATIPGAPENGSLKLLPVSAKALPVHVLPSLFILISYLLCSGERLPVIFCIVLITAKLMTESTAKRTKFILKYTVPLS